MSLIPTMNKNLILFNTSLVFIRQFKAYDIRNNNVSYMNRVLHIVEKKSSIELLINKSFSNFGSVKKD